MMKYQNATNKMTQIVTVKSLIWPWGQSSRSKVTNNGMRHIVWRWSTYMPNMKSLSWTTKRLQSGHDLLDAGIDLTSRSKLKVKGHQQWYTTHCLEVVYLHAKHEKPVLNDKKVTARTRFAMDAQTSLTLRSKFKVTNNATRHIVWRGSTYMPNMKSLSWTTKKLQPSHDLLWTHGPPTHRLEVVYLHAKYAKPVLNDKKVTDARTDAQTDHYRASATLLRGPNQVQMREILVNLTCINRAPVYSEHKIWFQGDSVQTGFTVYTTGDHELIPK
jgi:hypothetical protein